MSRSSELRYARIRGLVRDTILNVGKPRAVATTIGGVILLFTRGILLWLFLIPSLAAWALGVACWPVVRPFGRHVPISVLYYSRWATYLLDGGLSRITPLPATPWPWQVDVSKSRISSWNDAFDWPLS